MPETNAKWANFRGNSSHVDLGHVNLGNSNLVQDWGRASTSKDIIFNINGALLSELASSKYNSFATFEDVAKFINNEVLKKFKGSETEKLQAHTYLMQSFHQGGLLFPVSTALATEIKNGAGEPIITLDGRHRKGLINITSTPQGFVIQEYADITQVTPSLGFPYEDEGFKQYLIPLEGATPNSGADRIVSDRGVGETLIEAEATVSVDFSQNPTDPTRTVISNHLNIYNKGLSKLIDNRTFFEMLVDFLKNILGLNHIKPILPLITTQRNTLPVTKQGTVEYEDDNQSVVSSAHSTQTASDYGIHSADSDADLSDGQDRETPSPKL